MAHRLRKREPSGRISRAEAEDTAISPTAARRLRDEAARDVSRAEYGTELGRLFMAAKITPAQYQAGHRWHAHVEEWYRAIGAPFPHEPPGPIAALGTVGGMSNGEDPPVSTKEGSRILERRRRVMDQMHRADAVLDQGGHLRQARRPQCLRDRTPRSPATRSCCSCATASTASPATGGW